MTKSGWVAGLVLVMAPGVATANGGGNGGGNSGAVGLSLRIDDGAAGTIELVGNKARYVDELDILASATSTTDQGIDQLMTSGDFADLNWTGITMVEEDWRPDTAGTFTRQRFYRNADWMEKPSFFFVFQTNAAGSFLPKLPIVVYAGSDDLWSGLDGGFIRRFQARQVTTGCPAIDDCTGATGYTAQALVQLRQAQYPNLSAEKIAGNAAHLKVFWSQDPGSLRDVPITHVSANAAPFDYGFSVDLEMVSDPGADGYFVAGDSVTFKLNFLDGDGNALHDGALPTYGEFVAGQVESGLRYFDLFLNPTTYYALKHRESNLLLSLGGPSDAFHTTENTIPAGNFFLPQSQQAFADTEGYTAVVTGVPNFAIVFGGLLFDPAIWNTPVSDEVTLIIPADALPGTYVAAVKARRDYGGEAANAGDVIRIQVGTTEETEWEPTTGNCSTCHSGPTALKNVLHGIGDRESCFAGCHMSLEIEPDAALDYRTHFVHSRSDRYPADPDDCTVCHFEEPDGIPRGYPGFVYPFD